MIKWLGARLTDTNLRGGGIVESGEQIPPERDRSAGLDDLAPEDGHGRRHIAVQTK